MDAAKRFFELFHGLEKAYGSYGTLDKTKADGKKVSKQIATVRKPVTLKLWQDHLEGKAGIGIIPITDDSTCKFGAIDVDVYQGLDFKDIANRIYELNLPLIPCRSKSGGCHLYLFTQDWVPAELMQRKMKEIAAVLGYGNCEIYPKQTEILAERGDLGQWINMPYFDNVRGQRFAVRPDGQPYQLEEFLDYAEKKRITIEELETFAVVMSADLEDGPPCLQFLCTQGFPEGTRNDGLFNLGVYCKLKYPDDWERRVESFNVKYMQPPLSTSEVQGVHKSAKKKDYFYTCSKPPIQPHCNSTLCRNRKYGIGNNGSMPIISGLTKFDSNPPIWFMDVDGGGRLELTTDDLQNQQRFQRKCMDKLNSMPPQMSRTAWQQLIQHLLDNVTIIDAPMDASPVGQLFEHLERFCTGRAQAANKDELLLGKPWRENGRHYFRMSDFMSYLERNHFKEFKVNQITAILTQNEGKHHFFNVKGKGVNCWSIPSFEEQKEGFSLPDYGQGVPF